MVEKQPLTKILRTWKVESMLERSPNGIERKALPDREVRRVPEHNEHEIMIDLKNTATIKITFVGFLVNPTTDTVSVHSI